MGCSKLFFQIMLVILAVVGLNSLGWLTPIKTTVTAAIMPQPQRVEQTAQKIADFSAVPQNYKIENSFKFMGAEGLYVKNNKDGGYIAMGSTGPLLSLKKEDIKSEEINKKITYLAPVLMNSPAKISNFAIMDKSSFNALGQEIPYARIKIVSQTNPNISYEGIKAVYEAKDKTTKTIVSFNEAGKYRQYSTEQFLKNVKLD